MSFKALFGRYVSQLMCTQERQATRLAATVGATETARLAALTKAQVGSDTSHMSAVWLVASARCGASGCVIQARGVTAKCLCAGAAAERSAESRVLQPKSAGIYMWACAERGDRRSSHPVQEKRKRDEGKQSRGKSYVEEEKRLQRQFGVYSGFDT